jgi:hypothetical protein
VEVEAREGLALRYPIAVAAVVVLGFAPYGSLSAQPAVTPYPYGYFGGGGYALSPHEITASVRSKGLRPLSRPRRQGAAYVLRALDAADRELQVTVDPGTGRILRVAPVASAAPEPVPYPPDRTEDQVGSVGEPRPGTPPVARPHASAPASRPAQEAAAPPLPRARPKEATAPSLSASAADPVPVAPVPEIEE